MTRTLRTIRLASEELAAAATWYEAQRAGLGLEFLRAVTAAVERIAAHPESGSPVADDPRTRRSLVGKFPYEVAYRLRDDDIVIVAFAHLKRRPGYWKTR